VECVSEKIEEGLIGTGEGGEVCWDAVAVYVEEGSGAVVIVSVGWKCCIGEGGNVGFVG